MCRPMGDSFSTLQTTAVNRRSLGILPLARPRERRLFGGEEGAASFASFSPDGRFVAFQSDESGRPEVYLRPVEGSSRSVPVSGAADNRLAWRPTASCSSGNATS
jgi:Tol biopolymer transport system component